jgi:hypothetical protein
LGSQDIAVSSQIHITTAEFAWVILRGPAALGVATKNKPIAKAIDMLMTETPIVKNRIPTPKILLLELILFNSVNLQHHPEE